MKKINRRSFVSNTFLASSGILLSNKILLNDKEIKKNNSKNENCLKNKKRKLGSLEVSAIGLGGLPVNGFYGGGIREQKFVNTLYQKAYDNGITFFDTAEVYGPLTNEKQIGEAIASFRKNVVLSTKFGFNIDPITAERKGIDSKPTTIKKSVEGSLKRLKTDYIDLLYQHRVDPLVPIEDVAGTVKDLIQEGKVLHWGLSEPGIHTLQKAHKILPVTAIQNEYSLWTRDYETSILPLCEKLGIGFVPWCPLGYGFLGGLINDKTKFTQGDFRNILPRIKPENLTQNLKLIEFLKIWAKQKNCTVAQISLAWLQAQKPWIVPIPGTSNMDHLVENINSIHVHFTTDELQAFNSTLYKINIAGLKNAQIIIDGMGVEAIEKI
jgi:aryl-alcohol dehydrogenase-like predicted oxidoreductase